MRFVLRFAHGVRRYAIEALSLDSVSGDFLILAANYVFLMIYATLESVFVNTLLYRIKPDITIVIVYRAIMYITSAATMQIAAYLGQKHTPVNVIRLGGVFYLMTYLTLFLGMNRMNVIMYPAAVFTGMGLAFYFSGHNTLITHYTRASNRDIGISILGIIQGVAVLSVPVISGSIISLLETLSGSADTGYRIVFGLGMLTVISHVYYQRKLPAVEQTEHISKFRLAIKMYRRKLTYKYIICGEILRGFREGAFGFILNMILFEIITSESLVGFNSLLTGIAAIIGAWVYGKLVKPLSRARYTVISTTVMLVFCSLILLKQTAPVVMIFAVINAFFALFITNISTNTMIDAFTENKLSLKCLGESVALREIWLDFGRIAGLLLFVIFPPTLSGRIYVMLILTASQYLLAFFVNLTARKLHRKEMCAVR